MTVTKQNIISWLQACAAVLEENRAYLTELDSAIGDADHGTNIARGFIIVAKQVTEHHEKNIGDLLKTASMAIMSKVGGASGMLYGNFFMKAAVVAKDKKVLTADELAILLEEGLAGIIARGRADPGDKTMVDAWTPAIDAFKAKLASGKGLNDALQDSARAAKEGMKSTIPLQARKGRASYLGERSIGHQDPGATSTYLIIQALSDVFSTQ